MSSSTVFQQLVQGKQSLPVSHAHAQGGARPGIRRRLSSSISLNLKIQPSSTSNAGNSIRKWWEWGWGWILSRKPTLFATDLEMNHGEEEISHNYKGSWRHVFYKVTSQLRRKLLGSDDN